MQTNVFSVENTTSHYPFVLSLELSDRWNDFKPYSVYLEVNNRLRYSRINIDEEFGLHRMRLDSLTLFNLSDTTSITWDAVCLDWHCSSYFSSLFSWPTPPWKMSKADSLSWYISRDSWRDFEDFEQERYIPYIRALRITDELLGVMEKDYSMLERFAEFYELANND
jgi:hypothetical protein